MTMLSNLTQAVTRGRKTAIREKATGFIWGFVSSEETSHKNIQDKVLHSVTLSRNDEVKTFLDDGEFNGFVWLDPERPYFKETDGFDVTDVSRWNYALGHLVEDGSATSLAMAGEEDVPNEVWNDTGFIVTGVGYKYDPASIGDNTYVTLEGAKGSKVTVNVTDVKDSFTVYPSRRRADGYVPSVIGR